MLTGPPLGLSYTFPLLNSHCPVLLLGSFSYYFGLLWPISSIWGFLSPLHFFGHPWLIPLLHSYGLPLNLSGFPTQLPYHLLIPYLRLLRPIFAWLPFLMIPMGFLWAYLLYLWPFYHFIGLWTIIPVIQV